MSFSVYIYTYIDPCIYVYVYISIYLSLYSLIYLFTYLFIYEHIPFSVYVGVLFVVSLRKGPYYLASILGPLIFGNSHVCFYVHKIGHVYLDMHRYLSVYMGIFKPQGL